MELRVLTICLILMGTLSCSPCKNLQTKDQKVLQQFENLQIRDYDKSSIKYRTRLQALYAKEQALLRQVKACEFENPTDYNYWYGKRLKFSSSLERAWLELKRASQGEQKTSELRD